MFVVLALASAACYGAADFLGGIAAKRAATAVVVFVSQAAGLVLLTLLLPLLPTSAPVRSDHLWGAASGVAGSAGVALLYRALAIGTMSIVAPTTAVCAAAVPVLAALALGERPGVRAAIGIVMAVMAIALLSRGESTRQLTSVRGFCPSRSLKHRPSPLEKRGLHHQTQGSSGVDSPATPPEPNRQRRAGLGLAVLSGVAVGLFFLCLARTSPDAGMWPLIVGRSVSVPLFGAMALASRPRIRMPLAVARTAVSGGTLDMLANALYLVATRYGPLSLVATLASLYPASTVLLARVTLGERLTQWQSLGVGCALAAVVLIVSA